MARCGKRLGRDGSCSQEWRLGIGISSSGTISTLGKSDFDARFAASSFKIIRRTCPNCDADFQDIYYRRLGTCPLGALGAFVFFGASGLFIDLYRSI